LATKRYKKYLNSSKWKRKCRIYLREHNRCEYCHSKTELTVHHKNYYNFTNESDNDLQTLCLYCHQALHHTDNRNIKKKIKDSIIGIDYIIRQ
jgi:hypothetical protein